MLFKDLKQLGRGRRNSNETVSDTDADVITSAKTDAGADASADSQQADADDPTDVQTGGNEIDAKQQESTTVSELKRMNDEKASVSTDPDSSSTESSHNSAAADATGAESGNESTLHATADAESEAQATTEPAESELVEKMEKYREDYVRAVAELQNVKRRSESDISKAKKYGSESMARGLLDVKDSLDLARSVDLSDAREDAISKMQEGLNLTLKQLETVLEKHGVKPVSPAMGDKLDPALHQAMSMQPSSTVKPNHVLAVVQTGYQLHDRLLRAAMVVVATAEDEEAAGQAKNATNDASDGEQSATS